MEKKELNEYVKKYQEGDQEAFNKIYEETSALVFNKINSLVHNKAIAEDLTQETFFKVAKKINLYKQNNFYGWITTIAYNTAINHLNQPRQKEIAIDPYDNDFLFITDESKKKLIRELNDYLEGDEKTLFELFIIKGYPIKEIALMMNTDLNHIYYLRKKLYETIKIYVQ